MKKAAGTAPDDAIASWPVEKKEPRVNSQSSEEMRRTSRREDEDIAMALEGEREKKEGFYNNQTRSAEKKLVRYTNLIW